MAGEGEEGGEARGRGVGDSERCEGGERGGPTERQRAVFGEEGTGCQEQQLPNRKPAGNNLGLSLLRHCPNALSHSTRRGTTVRVILVQC